MTLTTRHPKQKPAINQVLGNKYAFEKMQAAVVFIFMVFFSATDATAQPMCSPPDSGIPANVTSCANPEFSSCSIDVDGIPRHFCLHVPDQPTESVPLVIGFHGGGGMARRAVNWMDKHTEQGMILVAPTALPSTTSCTRFWRSLNGNAGPSAIPDWAAFGNAVFVWSNRPIRSRIFCTDSLNCIPGI